MFSLISGFVQWALAREELKLLIIGLDGAGKTTLLEQLKRAHLKGYRGAPLESLPATIGMNLARLPIASLDVTIWDVGGTMHTIWDRYYADADGLIFVVDASDPSRFERARATLTTVASHPALADIPVLLLANKSDVPGAASASDVHDLVARHTPLGAAAAAGGGPTRKRTSRIFAVSALRETGVAAAVEWLVEAARAHGAVRERRAAVRAAGEG